MKDFREFLAIRRDRSQPIVLATVVDTSGSTYSKSGDRLLIDSDGLYRGLLSGGCLEGDLGMRAREVLDSCAARLVTYDLANDDDLWGMGVGCEGCITILLQPLTPAGAYEPLASVLALTGGDEAGTLVTVVEGESPRAGDAVLFTEAGRQSFGIPDEQLDEIRAAAEPFIRNRRNGRKRVSAGGRPLVLHCARVEPPPRLLVLGGAPDAVPLLRFADELGWRCTIADHRPAYLVNDGFAAVLERVCVAADRLSGQIDLSRFDAAVVMSHHLDSDRSYLRQLAPSAIRYVGLLGPPARRDRLLAELGDEAALLADRLHAPAGLSIGGRGPAPIALSIVAEIQRALLDAD